LKKEGQQRKDVALCSHDVRKNEPNTGQQNFRAIGLFPCFSLKVFESKKSLFWFEESAKNDQERFESYRGRKKNIIEGKETIEQIN